MKKTFARIMAVAMTIAMLASLILGVMPVGAITAGTVTVTLTPATISTVTQIQVKFDTAFSLTAGTSSTITGGAPGPAFAVTAGQQISVSAIVGGGPSNLQYSVSDPNATKNGVVTAILAATNFSVAVGDVWKFAVAGNLTDQSGNNLTVYVNNGTGGDTITAKLPVASYTLPASIAASNVTVSVNTTLAVPVYTASTGVTVNTGTGEITIGVPVSTVGPAHMGIRILTGAGIANPGTPISTLVISMKTSQETTYVDSAAFSVVAPGRVDRYNSAGNFLGSYSTSITTNSIATAVAAAATGDDFKVIAGSYTEGANIVIGTGTTVTGVILESVPGTNADTTISISSGFNLQFNGNNCKVDDFTISGTGNIVVNSGVTGATLSNCIIKGSGNATTLALLTVSGGINLTTDTFDTSAQTTTPTGTTSTALTSVLLNTGSAVSASAVTFKTRSIPTGVSAIVVGNTGVGVNVFDKCTFTGGGNGYVDLLGANAAVNTTAVTIKNSTFTGMFEAVNITVAGAGAGNQLILNGNTIDSSTSTVTNDAQVDLDASGGIQVTNNIISNGINASIGILANANKDTIVGNQFISNAKGLMDLDGVNTLNATLNYWGSANGPTTATVTGGDTIQNSSAAAIPLITYKPFLSTKPSAAGVGVSSAVIPTAGDTFAFTDVSGNNLVGVIGYTGVASTSVVVGEKLTTNPQTIAPPNTSIAYFDLFTSTASTTAMQAKFYATGITPNTAAMFFSGLTGNWVTCSSQGVSGDGSYVYVNFSLAGALSPTTPNVGDLTGTYFVLVNGPAPAPPAFDLVSPAIGGNVGQLTNIALTWTPVAGASTYSLAISSKPDLNVNPISGLVTPAYLIATTTPGTYFWQVTAYNGNTVVAKSAVGSFTVTAPTTTVATTPVPPVTITTITTVLPTPPPVTNTTTTIVVSQPPATTVTLVPAPITQTNPAWVWGIIGIGAVLIIVVIVLIVRTRRNA